MKYGFTLKNRRSNHIWLCKYYFPAKKRRNLSCIYTLIHPMSSMIEPDIFSLNNLLELQNYNNVILINI